MINSSSYISLNDQLGSESLKSLVVIDQIHHGFNNLSITKPKSMKRQLNRFCKEIESGSYPHYLDVFIKAGLDGLLNEDNQTKKFLRFSCLTEVLGRASSKDSLSSLKDIVREYYLDSSFKLPEEIQTLIDVVECFDKHDAEALRLNGFLRILINRAVALEKVAKIEVNLEDQQIYYYPLIKKISNLTSNCLSFVLEEVDVATETLLSKFDNYDKELPTTLIPELLSLLSQEKDQNYKQIKDFLYDLIDSDDVKLADLAGYTLFLLASTRKDNSKFEIYAYMLDRYKQANEYSKEFWLVALAEYSSYLESTASRLIDFLKSEIQIISESGAGGTCDLICLAQLGNELVHLMSGLQGNSVELWRKKPLDGLISFMQHPQMAGAILQDDIVLIAGREVFRVLCNIVSNIGPENCSYVCDQLGELYKISRRGLGRFSNDSEMSERQLLIEAIARSFEYNARQVFDHALEKIIELSNSNKYFDGEIFIYYCCLTENAYQYLASTFSDTQTQLLVETLESIDLNLQHLKCTDSVMQIRSFVGTILTEEIHNQGDLSLKNIFRSRKV